MAAKKYYILYDVFYGKGDGKGGGNYKYFSSLILSHKLKKKSYFSCGKLN